MTLAEQLLAVCDENNLQYLAIHVYTLPDGERFLGGSAHAGGIVGMSKGRGNDPAECLSQAIADLAIKRAELTRVPELAAA